MKLNTLIKLSVAFLLFSSASVFSDIAIIVHPSNSSSLDKSTIAKIFLDKQKRFSNGGEAIPLNLKGGSDIRSNFTTTILKKNSAQAKAYWTQLLFTGKGTPPKEMETDADVVRLVSANPALIGYIDSKSADDTVKVVLEF